jgi:hypothetical protein
MTKEQRRQAEEQRVQRAIDALFEGAAPNYRPASTKNRDPRTEELAPTPIHFAAEPYHPGAASLVCPLCGDTYVHFSPPTFVDGDDYRSGWVRGEVISILMSCERHDHRWSLEIGFHKGGTLMRYAPTWSEPVQIEVRKVHG